MKSYLPAFLALLFFGPFLFAQKSTSPTPFDCGGDVMQQDLWKKRPELAAAQAALDGQLAQAFRQKQGGTAARGAAVLVLPVVVHIIHNGGSENISDAQVADAVQNLNDAFAHGGYYAQAGAGVDVGIQFCLARRTPDGLPTKGINRVVSTLTKMDMETDDLPVKDLSRWDPTRYVNIWVVESINSLSSGPGVAGYAYFPSSHGRPEDGMVCEAQLFGVSPQKDAVLIHEMGHYLGLYHTFEGGCKNDDCLTDGDRVCDTPPDQAKHTACPFNSCTTDTNAPTPNPFTADVNDMTENFMDYSPFECVYRFTQGQTDRMQEAVTTVRQSLLESDGCLDACNPLVKADFSVTPPSGGVAGVTANFTNNTTGGASYQWFVNGTLVSTAPNPAYTFNFSGVFSIKLLATNGPQGCVDSFSMGYVVTCPVEAAFTADKTSIKEGESVLFTSTATGGGTLEWFINGVSVGSGPTLNFTFPTEGVYNVVLRVTGAVCSDDFLMPIEVKSECANSPCPEICDNGKDDDKDGYVDCYDTDCQCFDGADCLANNLNPDATIEGKLAWRTPEGIACVISSPIVANLNPQTDTIPEIIVVRANAPVFRIFKGDGSNVNNPNFLIPTAGFAWNGNYPVIGDINKDGIPEFITVENDNQVRVYRNYKPGTNPCMTLWMTSDLPTASTKERPMLADFDQDGQPEVYAGNDVFRFDFSNPAAPQLLLALNGASHSGRATTIGTNLSTAVDLLTPADCNGDPDCEGLELVAGSVIYSVDLNPLDGDGFQIKAARDLNTMQTTFKYTDGYTSVADVDLDGTPDIVVSGTRQQSGSAAIYIWNKNGLLRYLTFPGAFFANYQGLTTIANVYDDTKSGYAKDYPEIIICGVNTLTCFNLNKANTTPATPFWWNLPNSDDSGKTGSTVFDFNGDGLQEIVYRDQSDLRIMYGGAAPFPPGVDTERNWWKTTVGSVTLDEIPVVADVDNDGHADIAVNCFEQPFVGPQPTTQDGRLQVFKSAKIPWMPCRPMWNQHNYNHVNINDDLTVPQVQQKHWLEFPGPGGGKYPFNTALAQLSRLNSTFTTGYPVPDASAVLDTFFCGPNGLSLQIRICNTGSVALPDSTPLQFYLKNPTATTATPYGTPFFLKGKLAKDSCRTWAITIPLPANGTLWGVVNDNGSLPTPFDLTKNFPSTKQPECDYLNNVFSLNASFSAPKLDLGPDRTLCSSSVSTLSAAAGFARYRWNDGSPDSTFTAFGSGTYWVDAWDICGKKYSDTLRINLQNTAIKLGPDRNICPGDSIQLALTGFDQVQWSPRSVFGCPDCASVTLAPDSSVVLRVSGQVGNCIVSDSMRVQVRDFPLLTATVTNGNCLLGNSSIAITAAGGNAGLTFKWESGQNTATLDSLPSGTYRVTVSNALGCSVTKTYEIQTGGSPLLTDTAYTAIRCFSEKSGGIAVTPAGGTAPYNFAWSNDPTAKTNSQTGLAAGTYGFTVTDAQGCSSMANFQLTEPPALVLTAVMDSTNCQKITASISASAAGGSGPYTFEWNTGAKTPDLNNQPPGQYSVILKDANGCSSTRSFEIKPGGPPLLTDTAYTAIRCFSEKSGGIAVTPAGGTAPYQFAWSNDPAAKTNSQTALAAGTYGFTLTDAKGCSSMASFSLTEPPTLVLTAVMDSTDCQKATASITASAAGGTAPYTFEWNTGAKTSDLNNQPPGQYSVVLTDANGCTSTRSFEIKPGGSPLLTDTAYTAIRCFSEKNGGIAVTPAGGTAPYQFAWSNDPAAKTNSQTNLAAGTYGFTLTDAKGCTSTASFQLTEPPALVLTAVMDSTDCQKATASITASAAGGTAPYTFEWNTGAKTPDLNNQPPGQYSVTLKDANGCTSTRSFEVIPGGSPLLTDTAYTAIRCFSEKNGGIAVTPAGGTAPYQFAWSNDPAAKTNSQTNLAAGAYALTITDVQGCSSTASFSLTEPPALVLTAVMDSTDCQKTTASISTSAAGGSGPYTFEWNTGAKTPDLNNQPPGQYSVVLKDANGCTSTRSFEVKPGGSLALNLTGGNLNCLQTSATLTAGPLLPNLVFLWTAPDGSLLSGPQQQVSLPGLYQVTVTDLSNQCSTTSSIEVLQGVELTGLNWAADSVSCFGFADGVLRVLSVEGGTTPFEYSLDNQTFTPNTVFEKLAEGTYTLRVRDAVGCTFEQAVQVSEPAPLSVTLTASDTVVSKGAVVQLAASTTPPDRFLTAISWQPLGLVSFNGLTAEASLAASTLFQIQVSDEHGCTALDSLRVQVKQGGFYFPNALAPNSTDNGGFTIYADHQGVKVKWLRVYSRWGELIFERSNFPAGDASLGWQGDFRGKKVQPGVYIFTATVVLEDGSEQQLEGDVTVF